MKSIYKKILKNCPFLLSIIFISSSITFALEIKEIVPSGENISPYKNEITITFDKDMSYLGMQDNYENENNTDNENTLNIKNNIVITPKLDCDYRWLSTNKLVCRLNKILSYGTTYKIEIKKGLTALDGTSLKEDFHASFNTELAKVNEVSLQKGLLLSPKFIVTTNTIVDPRSLNLKFLYDDKEIGANIKCKSNCYKCNTYCYDTNVQVVQNAMIACLYKNFYDYSKVICEVTPKEDLPYNKDVLLIADKGLKTFDGDLEGKKSELKKFKIDDKYAKIVLKKEHLPNNIEFIVSINDDLKNYNFFYEYNDNENNIKKVPLNISQEISLLDCANNWQCKNNLELNKRMLKLTQTSSLPYDKDIKLVIEDVITRNDVNLSNQEIGTFKTYGSNFKLTKIVCKTRKNNVYKDLKIRIGNKNIKNYGDCDPSRKVTFYFNSPLNFKQNSSITYFTNKKLKSIENKFNISKNSMTYPIFQNGGKRISIKNIKIKDIFGRELQPFSKTNFKMRDFYKTFTFYRNNSVLEKDINSDVPISITNENKFIFNYKIKTVNGEKVYKNKIINLPVIKNKMDFVSPLGIRNLLNNNSGAIEGTLISLNQYKNNLNIKDKNERKKNLKEIQKNFFSQITPFHIHFKLGHFSSLLWVTSLDDGTPVADADVEVMLSNSKLILDDNTKQLFKTKTNKDGIAVIPGANNLSRGFLAHEMYYCNKKINKTLLIKVTKNDDLGILPANCRFTDSMEDLSLEYNYINAWGTTTQGVYKKGDNVPFKIIVRNQDNNSLALPPLESYKIILKDPMDNIVSEINDIRLSDFGTYANEFEISKSGYTGWYTIYLSANYTKNFSWEPLRFLVSDFTPASYKVKSFLDKKKYYVGENAIFDVTASLYAGGPLANGKYGIYARVMPGTIKPVNEAFLGYDFRYRKVNWDNTYEAIQNQDYYDTYLNSEYGLSLDDKGNSKKTIVVNDLKIPYGKLIIEGNVEDERGKSVTTQSQSVYIGNKKFLGVKTDSWIVYVNNEVSPKFIVINEDGQIVKNAKIDVEVRYKNIKVSNEKDANGIYRTNYITTWEKLNECKVDFIGDPVSCNFIPKNTGSYIVHASVIDDNGKKYEIVASYYALASVASDNDNIIEDSNEDDEISLTPTSKSFNVGETAKVLVFNPYPNSYALITKERYGVKESYVKKLTKGAELVEFKINENDFPGVYVSVVVMSPRVKDAKLIDACESKDTMCTYRDYDDDPFGKPKVKFGYTKLIVNGENKKLKINVKTLKDEYRPKDEVTADINVTDLNGKGVQSELGVIVLDEAVFDLIQDGFNYFNPYEKFYGLLKKCDVINYNIIKKLIGKIQFKKGFSPSAGGGDEESSNLRNNFKYVAYWNSKLVTNNEGKVSVTFNVPDNLTSWKVIVFGVDKKDKLGADAGTFKVSQPIEVRSLMPNSVRIGDTFSARVSILNRSKIEKDFTLVYSLGTKEELKKNNNKEITVIKLSPFKRYELSKEFKASSLDTIYFDVTAKDTSNNQESGHEENDRLISKVKVLPVGSKETQSIYGSLLENDNKKLKETLVKLPKDILKANFSFSASTTILNSLDGVFRYMKDYVYPCWEQKTSRALVSLFYAKLKEKGLTSYDWKNAGVDFTKKMILKARDYQAPNGGMGFFTPQNASVSPYLSAYTLFAFNIFKDANLDIPKDVEEQLVNYLKGILHKDDVLFSKSLVVNELSKLSKIEKSEILRIFDKRDNLSLFEKSFLLEALNRYNETKDEAKIIFNDILNHKDETTSKVTFEDTYSNYPWWSLESSMRTNCSILSALINYQKEFNKDNSKDEFFTEVIQKLAHSISSGINKNGSFLNTQENIFCTKALIDYANAFENYEDVSLVASLFEKEIFNNQIKKEKLLSNSLKNVAIKNTVELSKNDLGKEGSLKIIKDGKGSVYYNGELSYISSKPLPRVNAGMNILREFSVKRGDKYEVIKDNDALKIGDMVRVDIYLTLPTFGSFVVINSPLPGALEPVNEDLGTTTSYELSIFNKKSAYTNDSYIKTLPNVNEYGFYFKELLSDSARFYSEYLSKGNHHVSFLTQVVARGEFVAPPAFAEQMYNPEIFGRGEAKKIVVK